jgi:hypothetical protein
MSASPDDFACHALDRLPPAGRPLAIYAISATSFNEWFEGEYDAGQWRVRDLPDSPAWYVRGWRLLDAPIEGASSDCRTLNHPPTDEDPRLVPRPA